MHRRSRSNSKSRSKLIRLGGGKYIAQGTHGCSFLPPLALQDVASASALAPAPASVGNMGKIMDAYAATAELKAMQPFIAIDREGVYGVYATSLDLKRVDLSLAIETAQGAHELARCTLTHATKSLGKAARIATEAHATTNRADADAVVRAYDEAHRAAKMRSDEEIAVFNALPPPATQAELMRRKLQRAEVIKNQDNARDFFMYQIETKFFAGGDMNAVLAKLWDRFSTPSDNVDNDAFKCMYAFANLAQGLAVYHGAGLVHRDIKPANIVISDDKDGTAFKFIDFGSALTRQDAAIDKYQESRYSCWPLITTLVFNERTMGRQFTVSELRTEFVNRALLCAPFQWLPAWEKTTATISQMHDALRPIITTDNAALYADVYSLFVTTLPVLYFAATGVTFCSNRHGGATWKQTQTLASPSVFTDRGAHVHELVAQLIHDVCCGRVISAQVARDRFQVVLDALRRVQFGSGPFVKANKAKAKAKAKPKAKATIVSTMPRAKARADAYVSSPDSDSDVEPEPTASPRRKRNSSCKPRS